MSAAAPVRLTAEPATSAKPAGKRYTLLDVGGCSCSSTTPGTLGGHRRSKIYGRLDCRAAAGAIAAGGYRTHRVFFADQPTAIAAGYRPCAVCLPEAYRTWKNRSDPGRDARRTASATCSGW